MRVKCHGRPFGAPDRTLQMHGGGVVGDPVELRNI